MIRSFVRALRWLVSQDGLRSEFEDLKRRTTDIERLVSQNSWDNDDLRHWEQRRYSQNGEDGIIEEIFGRIGTTNRYFVEIGVESGEQCNCRRLAEDGWSGLFIERHEAGAKALSMRYGDASGIACRNADVRSSNVETLLREAAVPLDLDLLSIDIDGNDYWVWKAINERRPRVVIIEYNAAYRPPIRWVMPEDDEFDWKGDDYFGASLQSLMELGRRKGYRLVTTDSAGVNAFFVRDELALADRFVLRSVGYHYSPPSYGERWAGHPVSRRDSRHGPS